LHFLLDFHDEKCDSASKGDEGYTVDIDQCWQGQSTGEPGIDSCVKRWCTGAGELPSGCGQGGHKRRARVARTYREQTQKLQGLEEEAADIKDVADAFSTHG
jgi:hypothetical protein